MFMMDGVKRLLDGLLPSAMQVKIMEETIKNILQKVYTEWHCSFQKLSFRNHIGIYTVKVTTINSGKNSGSKIKLHHKVEQFIYYYLLITVTLYS